MSSRPDALCAPYLLNCLHAHSKAFCQKIEVKKKKNLWLKWNKRPVLIMVDEVWVQLLRLLQIEKLFWFLSFYHFGLYLVDKLYLHYDLYREQVKCVYIQLYIFIYVHCPAFDVSIILIYAKFILSISKWLFIPWLTTKTPLLSRVQFLFLLIFHLYYLIFLIDLNTKVLPLDDYAFNCLLPEYCF